MIRLYRLLAKTLLPTAFYREYGLEVEESMQARFLRTASLGGRSLLMVRESTDLLRTAVRERWRELRGTGSERPADGGLAPKRGGFGGSIGRDLHFALRGLAKNPTFTATTVLTLALGIGAVASIFAVADALLLRPLPYAQGWVEVGETPAEGGPVIPLRLSRMSELREVSSDLFDGWVAYRWAGLARTDRDRTELIDALALLHDTGRNLGIGVILGRGFSSEDAVPGAPSVALLTDTYWTQLGRDPTVVGSTIRIEGQAVTVVGILESDIAFPPEGREIDVWLPLREDFTFLDRRSGGVSGAWARTRDGLSLEPVRARVGELAAELSLASGAEEPWTVELEPVGGSRGDDETRQAFRILSATVVTIFLIALVNGVNLFIVRTNERAREIALRVALGASRVRILRQITVEGLVLGLLAGGAAIALAWGSLILIRGLLPETVLYLAPHAISIETRTLGLVFLAALTAGTALGLIPGVRVLRRRFASNPFLDRHPDGRSRRHTRLNGLVVSQVALSMILVVHAVLLAGSFSRLHDVDLGSDPERLVIADFEPSSTRYPERSDQAEFTDRLVRALENRPEIESVAVTLGVRAPAEELEAEGRPIRPDQPDLVPYSAVTPNYIAVTGGELVSGRAFDSGDIGSRNAIVDLDLALFLWNDESPIGRRFRLGEDEWWTVVGVVRELRLLGRDQREGPHQFLTPRDPLLTPYAETIMRVVGPAENAVPVFQSTLNAVDPQQVYWRARTVEQYLASIEQNPRFVLLLIGLLAAVALALAAFGLYGVLSYSVARRKRELGIRAALGARSAGLTRMVMTRGLVAAGVGIAIGTPLGLLGSRLVERFLYEVPTWDPVTYFASGAVLLIVAAVATWIPAMRATAVDPVVVLAAE